MCMECKKTYVEDRRYASWFFRETLISNPAEDNSTKKSQPKTYLSKEICYC